MIKILKVLFSDNKNIQKCFAIRKKVFVEEQNCDPKDEYENEEESQQWIDNLDVENEISIIHIQTGFVKKKTRSKLEYIWLDGYKPTQSLRGKTMIVDNFSGKLEDCI